MVSGKLVKIVVYEALQFAALVVPVFVIMERFGSLMEFIRRGDKTAYWLVVAASIAYVTSVTLLVWVPLKYVTLKRRRFITEIYQWRPTALVYLLLTTLPCFAILITSSKVQLDRGLKFDRFIELPVSLVLFSLICVDIIERIRHCRLMGKTKDLDSDLDVSGPVLTHLEHVTSVSGQLPTEESQNGSPSPPPVTKNGSAIDRWRDPSSASRHASPRPAYLYSSSARPWDSLGPLSILGKPDLRSNAFVQSFLFWFDTVELVRVAGQETVFYSVYIFPVLIFAYLSTLRMILVPQSPLLSAAGVALQDLPFFVLRVALIAEFGFVTPLLFPLKNVLVSLTFIYFTFLTRVKIFRRRNMF
ncbi:transmembrane protein 236 [Gouania willdenowi]|uniref:Transmembrane protein 236 n=1 Tax=Gouania willdenowi TaxID=441366 RepID=A0A8C5GEQ2_GOUWI|nr:transmembrane protein 236 [Gouania willdenowi]